MWILFSTLLPFSAAIYCKQCFNYNGQVCVNAQDCSGNYCLIEEIVQTTGIKTTKKTCISQPYFQYPDGSYLTSVNQCTNRYTGGCQYTVKICNDQNYCNDACSSTSVLPTPGPPPTIFPPVVPLGMVQCFNCETYDGTDCRSNVCQGKYCLYERQITGSSMRVKKSCLQDATFVLDDGTPVQSVDVCEIRNTVQSQYFLKMCNDQDFCNGYCNPTTVEPPQREPLVYCYCDGPNCVNSRCQASYCVIERETRNGQSTTKRGCSSTPYVRYPDNTYSSAINQCEYKTINDVSYQLRVCNSGNFCNTDCPFGGTTGTSVTCTQCEANNSNDCSGTSCTGSYCLYELQQDQGSEASYVKKSCKQDSDFVYPDGSLYRTYGNCEQRAYNGITYTVKLCNSTSYCNSACGSNPYLITSSPLAVLSGSGITSHCSLLLALGSVLLLWH